VFKHFNKRITTIRDGLTTIDSHPIGNAVLVIVLFLDLFILVSIFDGLEDHSRQLTSPYQAVPQYCRTIVLDKKWNVDNQLNRTASMVSGYSSYYADVSDPKHLEQLKPLCRDIAVEIFNIENDDTLVKQLNTLRQLQDQIEEVRTDLERFRSAYDTSLLEKIAENDPNLQHSIEQGHEQIKDQGLPIEQRVSVLTSDLNRLAAQEARLEVSLENNEILLKLFSRINTIDEAEREQLAADLKQLKFWFPVKRLAMEILFLLPLILLFYWWHNRSIKANRSYQSLVSSHLLVIVFIPVIFKVFEFIYEIIPKKLLRKLFELLEAFNLIAIWHYLMMGAAIIGALVLIFVMQRKIFSPEKLSQKRISKGLCQDCGLGLHHESAACSSCGFKQFRHCEHCEMTTYVTGKYCRACGK